MVMVQTYRADTAVSPYIPTIPTTNALASIDTHSIFRSRPVTITYPILLHLERKERAVLLLLDNKRTLHDIARLTHRTDLEVAHILARLLRRGLIDYPAELFNMR
jgi:hypothetical protein